LIDRYYLCVTKAKNMNNTKEFQDIMQAFEKDAKRFVSIGSMGLTKEPKENWVKQVYYCDGNVNNAFKMFMIGVSFGKCYYN